MAYASVCVNGVWPSRIKIIREVPKILFNCQILAIAIAIAIVGGGWWYSFSIEINVRDEDIHRIHNTS